MLSLVAAAIATLVGPADTAAQTPIHQTFSATVYADHWEKHLPRKWTASYNISYVSSLEITLTEYGVRKRRCRYTFSEFTLTRRFSYDGLHQAAPYRVEHVQSGSRSWMRVPPVPAGEFKGSCAEAVEQLVRPAVATGNTLSGWKGLVDDDDAVVRRFLSSGTKRD